MKNQLFLKLAGALIGLAVVTAFLNARRRKIASLETFTIKISPGVSIEDAAELATEEAYESGVPVIFKFGDITLRARRGFSAGVIVRCYREAVGETRAPEFPDWIFKEIVMKAPAPTPAPNSPSEADFRASLEHAYRGTPPDELPS